MKQKVKTISNLSPVHVKENMNSSPANAKELMNSILDLVCNQDGTSDDS